MLCVVAVSSVVIRLATQVVVLGRDPLGFRLGTLEEVAPVGQDVAHMAVMPGAQLQGQGAGRLHALRPVALGQAEQPQATAVAVLGVKVG